MCGPELYKETGLWGGPNRPSEEIINMSPREQRVLATQSLLAKESATSTRQENTTMGPTSPAFTTSLKQQRSLALERGLGEVFQTQAWTTF